MQIMKVIAEGDGAWTDLEGRMADVIHLKDDVVIQVVALSGGMVSGRPSVSLRFDLPDGKVMIAETSVVLFLAAAEILRARYGDEI